MSYFKRWWVVIAVLVLMVTNAYAATPARPSISAAGKTALTQYLSTAVERGDVPGVVALIVDRKGVLYEAAVGKQDVAGGVDMKMDTIFRIASMTKPITSVATMMMVEEGKLKLDDPVSKFLPEFANRPVIAKFNPDDGSYETRPAKREITIRDVSAHISGLSYAFTNPVAARLLKGTKKTELELPLLHDPGERWSYSAGPRVLGWVIEKITGQPLDQFMSKRIFEPLKMTDTSWVVPSEKVSRVATLHKSVDGKLKEEANPPEVKREVIGDGGLHSSARDYGRFMSMMLNGGSLEGAKIISAKSVETMGKNQIGSVVIETQPAANPELIKEFPIGAGRDKFGIGFQITARDERYAKLRSPGSLSWAGINNTQFWIDPKRGIGAVVMLQVLPFYDDTCLRVLRDFEGLVYKNLK